MSPRNRKASLVSRFSKAIKQEAAKRNATEGLAALGLSGKIERLLSRDQRLSSGVRAPIPPSAFALFKNEDISLEVALCVRANR
jgi:hypothetical protein